MDVEERWFLSARERGNSAGLLYAHEPDASPWSTGNDVRPLVDGASYFARLCEELRVSGEGDQIYFVDWRGDPDERLDGPGTAVAVELARAASGGACVKGLIWRSHLDKLRFSESENRHLSESLDAVGGEALLDQRVRRNGSHHQKFIVFRRANDPARDVAFVGGIDLGHSRRDTSAHDGDPQAQQMSHWYGPTPPWHDAMVEIRGPAVFDLECCFRERWEDPNSPDYLRPWLWAVDRLRGLDTRPRQLPAQHLPPPVAGPHGVQLLRTYPPRHPRYPFAPHGERTVARGYAKALVAAQHFVYVEDQFFWSRDVAELFAAQLRDKPQLRLIAVLPRYPDSDGRLQKPAKDSAQAEALDLLYSCGGSRVQVYDLENRAGTPIYVHAKVCIVDDVWAAVGSANLNRRSWTHDSELTAAVVTSRGDSFARLLRCRLWAEHLDRTESDLVDVDKAAALFAESAAALDAWHEGGRRHERPPGQLRTHETPRPSGLMRRAIQPFVTTVVDPDARPAADRRANRW